MGTKERTADTPNTPYEAPTLNVVGSVQELTLGICKDFSGTDGMFLLNPANTLGSC